MTLRNTIKPGDNENSEEIKRLAQSALARFELASESAQISTDPEPEQQSGQAIPGLHNPVVNTEQSLNDPVGANSKNTANSQTGFKNYTPLKTRLLTVASFDCAMLPESFVDYVEDCSYRMQAPIDFLAVTIMVALSALVGRRVAIHPKQQDNWLVIANLWGAIIGRPAAMKSPTMNEGLRQISTLESKAKKEYEVAIAAFADELELHSLRVKNAKENARKAVKNNDEKTAKQLIKESSKSAPGEPTRRRYKVNDSTVEKLGELLNENANGLLVVRDELTGLLKDLDKPENSAARAFYLESWNGNQPFTYDRILRGTVDIKALTLSVIGGIQPGVLQPYIISAINGGVGDDGMLQRVQLMVYPNPIEEWHYADKAPNKSAMKKAEDVFACVDKISRSSQARLRFTPDAQMFFVKWLTELETKIRGGNLHPAIESHLAKYRSLVPSLALLIHVADNFDKFSENVGKIALLKACDWADYLESHARRIYSLGIQTDYD